MRATCRRREGPGAPGDGVRHDLRRPGHPERDRHPGSGLRQHQVIQQDTSIKTVELQDALDSTDRVLSAIDPAELSTTLAEGRGRLDGRGAELGGTLETLDAIPGPARAAPAALQEDLRLLGINLHVLAETSPDLLKALDDSLTTTRTITDKRRQFATSLTQAHGLVDTADAFLRRERSRSSSRLANTARHVRRPLRLPARAARRLPVLRDVRGARLARLRGRAVPAHRRLHQDRWRRAVHRVPTARSSVRPRATTAPEPRPRPDRPWSLGSPRLPGVDGSR